MAKIKKISELEQLSSLSSSSNIIIEENGQAKRIAASNLDGKVKTVNGIEPDENGNVQIKIASEGTPPIAGESVQSDWNQNDSTQPDYIKNRTHWEENNQTIIEWDGSTEGRDCATDESGMLEAQGIAFYKVSDLILTKDDVIGGTICVIMESIPSELTLTEDMVVAGDGVVNISNILVVFTNTTAVLDGVTLEVPSVGCYAASLEQGLVRFESLTCGSNTIHKLDPKFLPEGGFGWEGNAPIVINWDGNITEEMQANSFQIYGPETMTITKFSDLAPTRDDLIGGTLTVNGGTVSITEEYYEGVFEERDNHTVIGNSVYIFYDTNYSYGSGQFTVPSTGTYVYIKDKTPKSIAYGSAPVIHKIDEKFIPDTIARKSDIVPGGSGGVSSWNDLLDKPSSLPNPNSLTLTGAVNASYDGSEEVVVEIPVAEVPVTSVNGMTGDVQINIPVVPVTSVNGMTGDVVIDIHESTGSSFIITMTATSWTEQMGVDGLSTGVFASTPNCSHTFQEIDDAYKAGKTLIFALMESGDDTKHYLPLLSCGDFNGNTMYTFGIDFGTSFFSGYFLEGNARPYISRKAYMDKITVNSASVGQTVVVKSVDYKGVPTAWEAVDLYSGSSSQSDWNQNDPYQPDYVKSRTHWIEGSDYVIAELKDAPFAEDGGTDRIDIGDYGHLTVGNKYTVIWDGVEYSQLVAFDDGGYPTIGSPFNNIGSNFPFCIFTENLAGKISLCVSCADKTTSVHSFTVQEGGKVYHPIDEKFIPDTIARVDAPMNSVTLVSPNGTKFSVMIDDSGKLIVSNMAGDIIEQSSGNLPDAEEGEF